MFEKLDMIVLMVSNMSESIKFYRDLLGLEMTQKSKKWTTFKIGEMTLGLHTEIPGTEDERPLKYGAALAFNVRDVNAAWQEMQNKGAHILAVPRKAAFGKYTEITDPDGHIIMLISGK